MRPFGSRRDAATTHLWDYAGCRPLAFKGRILSYRSARYPHLSARNIRISLTRSVTDYELDDVALSVGGDRCSGSWSSLLSRTDTLTAAPLRLRGYASFRRITRFDCQRSGGNTMPLARINDRK